MGRIDQIADDWEAALAALAWQSDLGIDAVVQDAPVNRYEAKDPVPMPARTLSPQNTVSAQNAVAAEPDKIDVRAEAEAVAGGATSLSALRAALEAWPHSEIRRGARNLVFAGGTAGARVVIVGEAPDVDEDRQGLPFAGDKGALFDRMFAAIGLSRDARDAAQGLYLIAALPWRAVGAPDPTDMTNLRPFLLRHIVLAAPDIIVAMGNDAVSALLPDAAPVPGRGEWVEVLGRPLLAMQHPGHLLRNPGAKAAAWTDLLALKARLLKGAHA